MRWNQCTVKCQITKGHENLLPNNYKMPFDVAHIYISPPDLQTPYSRPSDQTVVTGPVSEAADLSRKKV